MGGGMGGAAGMGMPVMVGVAAPVRASGGLAGLVQALVEPVTWEATGGEGRIVRFRDCLVVRQGAENQWKIARALQDLQKLVQDVDLAARGPGAAAETFLATRLYRLRGESPETVRQMLQTLDETTVWNGGASLGNMNGGRIAVLKDGLVIRQKPDEHRRIRRWLERLEVLEGVVELDDQAEVSGEPSNIARGNSSARTGTGGR